MLKTDIAADSTNDLRDVIEHDATATFEDDPNFMESSPTINASTESVAVQRDTDDVEDSKEEDDSEEEDDEDLEDEDDRAKLVNPTPVPGGSRRRVGDSR